MSKTIEQTVEFNNVTPEQLFEIYIDSKQHAGAIDSYASISREVGGEFKAFGEDHVRGKNLAIVPNRMIAQSWRGQPWKEDDLDSILILTFSKTAKGVRIDLVQANVPDHAYEMIKTGWDTYYWNSWKVYLKRRPKG